MHIPLRELKRQQAKAKLTELMLLSNKFHQLADNLQLSFVIRNICRNLSKICTELAENIKPQTLSIDKLSNYVQGQQQISYACFFNKFAGKSENELIADLEENVKTLNSELEYVTPEEKAQIDIILKVQDVYSAKPVNRFEEITLQALR
ncbi:MAG: hypothetical protein M3R00_05480 [Pseudomonadota bacterium]|nr:hypothetical protein [Pseudomonadota bacterium]